MKTLGHTLAEILMVVAIVGALAYLGINRFDTHRRQTEDRTTKANIESLRMTISLYFENEGVWPNNSLSMLVAGSPTGTQYIAKIPVEAKTNKSTVVNVANYQGGWIWDTSLHKLRPNLTGIDSFGVLYSEY